MIPSTLISAGPIFLAGLMEMCNTGTPGIWQGQQEDDFYLYTAALTFDPFANAVEFRLQIFNPTIPLIIFQGPPVPRPGPPLLIMPQLHIPDLGNTLILCVSVVC
jgi:hypothetical protein